MKKWQVLIVDDEEDLRDVICSSIPYYGIEITQAQSGQEAFQLFKLYHFDLIISDIKMPNGDGLELLKNVHHYSKDTTSAPSFMLLSSQDGLDEQKLAHYGCKKIIKKPFAMEDLKDCVVELLQMKAPENFHNKTNFRSRKFPRLSLSSQIKLYIKNSGRPISIEQISLGGCFIPCDRELPIEGDQLEFQLNLGDYFHIKGEFEVKWIRYQDQSIGPRGYGIAFKEMSDQGMEILQKFIHLCS